MDIIRILIRPREKLDPDPMSDPEKNPDPYYN